jgi:spore maturation protein CgeB
MRILIVGAIQGGTVPLGPILAKAFAANNQTVDFLDYSDLLEELLAAGRDSDQAEPQRFYITLKTRLLERIIFFRPKVIFGIAQSPLNDPEILTQLKKAGIGLCFWFTEDYRVFNYWKAIAPFFDYFFTTQRYPFWQELADMGLSNYHYLPLAFDDTKAATTNKTPKISVSFVGAPYPNRVHYLPQMGDMAIYGENWSKYPSPAVLIGDRRISEEEALQIYSRTKININLHSSLIPTGFADGDFVNPRTFEIAGLGGFQLTDMRHLLPEHFDLQKEIVALSSFGDMCEAVKYYLKNEKERIAFAQKAKERVFEEHTYRHRAAAIAKLLC